MLGIHLIFLGVRVTVSNVDWQHSGSSSIWIPFLYRSADRSPLKSLQHTSSILTLKVQTLIARPTLRRRNLVPLKTMLSDDLPWPELGNVSRGATRGNQGQKGALGPPDQDGRCLLQLRVQPGVLVVKLNRQSSDWYRVLDGEVTRALKLTKTYWRKVRVNFVFIISVYIPTTLGAETTRL